MSSVKSVSIFGTDKAWSGGKVKRRYAVTLTDVNAVDHEFVIGPFKVDSSDNGMTFATNHLSNLKSDEVSQYFGVIELGEGNPFETMPAHWNTRAELLYPILAEALTLPATEPLVMNGLPLMALVSDEELMLMFGKDQTWVDEIRSNTATLLTGKTTLDAYVPMGID